MALYESVNGVARRIIKMYKGVLSDVPLYETQIVDVTITSANLPTYFTESYGGTYFFDGYSTFSSNNKGVDNSTAKTTWTAKDDMEISFNYDYSTENRYDKFYLTVADTVIENGVSGVSGTKSFSGTLLKGQSIIFEYTKDGSKSENDDKCSFWNVRIKVRQTVETGVTKATVAREITKAYGSENGVARMYFCNGIKWRKFDCVEGEEWTGGGKAGYSETITIPIGGKETFSSDYTFIDGNVYHLGTTYTLTAYTSTTKSDVESVALGNYYLHGGSTLAYAKRISAVNSVEITKSGMLQYLDVNVSYSAVTQWTKKSTYSKGDTYQGAIYTNEGELPESGTLIEGSANDNYCIIKVGSTHYYYERA